MMGRQVAQTDRALSNLALRLRRPASNLETLPG